MNNMFGGIIGGWEFVVILAVFLLLFGSKKLPELARGLGQGIKEFKKATREVTDEIQNAQDVTPPQKLPASGGQKPIEPIASQSSGNSPKA